MKFENMRTRASTTTIHVAHARHEYCYGHNVYLIISENDFKATIYKYETLQISKENLHENLGLVILIPKICNNIGIQINQPS